MSIDADNSVLISYQVGQRMSAIEKVTPQKIRALVDKFVVYPCKETKNRVEHAFDTVEFGKYWNDSYQDLWDEFVSERAWRRT